jgi:hypothetical protein
VFTSKNAPPIIKEASDFPLRLNPELFNYLMLWSPQPEAVLNGNTLSMPGNVFKVRIMQPAGAIQCMLHETVLTKTNQLEEGFLVRPIMHPVANQWEAPLFYSDEHSVFFISPDERIKSLHFYDGYYLNDAESVHVPVEKIDIPPLYEQPVITDPRGPIVNPLENFINQNYEQTISNNNEFVYRGTAFDANGVVTREIGQ